MSKKIHSAFALCEGISKNNRAIWMSSEWQYTVLEFSKLSISGVLMGYKILCFFANFQEFHQTDKLVKTLTIINENTLIYQKLKKKLYTTPPWYII
jgi:hypothetical protein